MDRKIDKKLNRIRYTDRQTENTERYIDSDKQIVRQVDWQIDRQREKHID